MARLQPASNSAPPVAALPLRPVADLFVTNLRLLDLDRKPDWPGITPRTFSTKDSQQNQKQRIRCVEWALFRLFEIWDADEARDKLQPFFPPLEPLQSLNLRAALYRSLNELKKNGVLGRESTLRKTMLDECKGDKLVEILVVFSTAVLRKVELARLSDARRAPVAIRLATASMLDPAQQRSLLPLAIAHRAALTRLLQRKEQMRERVREFKNLLDTKSAQLQERWDKCSKTQLASVSAAEEAQAKKTLHENWPGHSKWPETLLYGDDTEAGDQLLHQPFQDVWRVVMSGGTLQPAEETVGLLQNLEQRISNQAERLQKWQAFREKIVKTPTAETTRATTTAQTELPFQFNQHQLLQPETAAAPSVYDEEVAERVHTYQDIVAKMRTDLAAASRTKRDGGLGWSVDIDKAATRKPAARRSPQPGNITRFGPNRSAQDHILAQRDAFQPYKSAPFDNVFSPAKQPLPPAASINVPIPEPATQHLDLETRLRLVKSRALDAAATEARETAAAAAAAPKPKPSIPKPVMSAIPSLRPTAPGALQRSNTNPSLRVTAPNPPKYTPQIPQLPLPRTQSNPVVPTSSNTGGGITTNPATTMPPPPAPSQPSRSHSRTNSAARSPRPAHSRHSSFAPPSPSRRSSYAPASPSLPSPSPSPDSDDPAAKIIAGIMNAAPHSPTKRSAPLSLAERTRLSMIAHSAASKPALVPSSPPSAPGSAASTSPPQSPAAAALDRRLSLMERTRHSIALVPAHAPQPLRPARRTSLFPVNQFEGQGMRGVGEGVRRDATPTDALFSEDAEYESVFKSRPRVALSPVWSPSPEGERGVGLGLRVEEEEWVGSSPLDGRRERGVRV